MFSFCFPLVGVCFVFVLFCFVFRNVVSLSTSEIGSRVFADKGLETLVGIPDDGHQVWNGPLGPINTEIKRSILQILDFILGSL